MKLTDNSAIKTAFELTEEAIKNNLISKYEDEETTAKAVASFYKSLLKELTTEI